jgi:uncharacterized membrane protein YhaH (DUF805 family)
MRRAGPCLLDGFAQVTLFFLNLSALTRRLCCWTVDHFEKSLGKSGATRASTMEMRTVCLSVILMWYDITIIKMWIYVIYIYIYIYNMCEHHQAPSNTYNPHRENAMRPQNGSYHVLSSYFPVFQGTVAHDFCTWFFSHPNKWFEMEIIDAHLVNVPYFGTSLPTKVPAVWGCKIRPTLARCCRSSAHNSPSSSVNGLEVSEAENWDI